MMKLRLECDVESKTLIRNLLEINKGGKTYFFYPNDAGLICKIAIEARVDDPEKFYSTITETPDDPVSKATIEIRTDNELFESLESELREFESLLALLYNFKGVNWQSVRHELICETDEERQKATILGVAVGKAFPDEPREINERSLSELISIKDRYSSMIILLAFFREGRNDYIEQKFINAFFNFYFILEGMFGNGKTKNKDVALQFKKSDRLREFTQKAIDEFIKPEPKHLKRINEMLRRRNMTLGVDALIELIVLTRGELHHFTNNPNRPQNTPFSHNEYQTISFITYNLAFSALLFLVVDLNQAATKGSIAATGSS